MKAIIVFILMLCSVTGSNAAVSDSTRFFQTIDSLIELQKYREALPYVDSVLLLYDMDNVMAYEKGVYLYSQLKEYANAFNVSRNLTSIEPGNSLYNGWAGWFALLSASFTEAKQYLKKAVSIDANNYSTWLNLGHVYNCERDYEHADYYYGKAIEFIPDNNILEEGAIEDFRLLTKLRLIRSDTTSLIKSFRNTFHEYQNNHSATVLLDSIYQLVYIENITSSNTEVIRLKKRFCEEEQKNKVWRYSVLSNFYWDIGVAEYSSRNETKAIDEFLSTSITLSAYAKDTTTIIKRWIEGSNLASTPSFKLLYSAIDLAKSTGNPVLIQPALSAMAAAYSKIYQWDSCIYFGKQSWAYANKLSSKNEGDFFKGINHVKAEAAYDLMDIFAILRMCDSASCYGTLQKEYLQRSGGDFKEVFASDYSLGLMLYKCGDYKSAIDKLSSLISTNENSAFIDLSTTWTTVGLCYYQLNKLPEAEHALNNAIKEYKRFVGVQKNMRGLRPINEVCDNAFDFLKRIYAKQKKTAELFRIAEESKQSIFYAGLSKTLFPTKTVTLQQLQHSLKPGEVAINYSSSGKPGYGYAIAVTNKEVKLYVENIEDFKRSLATPVMQETRSEMDWMLTEMFKNSGRTKVTEDEEMLAVNAILSIQLNRAIGQYTSGRGLIIKGAGRNDNKTMTRITAWSNFLYQLYLYPFEDILKNATRIYISGEGITNYLPFEALKNNNGKYIGELYEVVNVPSFTISDILKQHPENRSGKMLAIGNPAYRNFNATDMNGRAYDLAQWGYGKWSDLPGTKKELEQLLSVDKNIDVLDESNVSESSITDLSINNKLSNYSYLHFAVHGMSKLDNYQDNSLILTEPRGTKKDGFLQFWEIAELRLNATLVCLSACETAVSGYQGNTDYNLPMAFILAGARSVIGTSWVVNDEATSIFMSEFYKKLLHQKMNASQALHATKQQFIKGEIKKEYIDPTYWAAFKYFGY